MMNGTVAADATSDDLDRAIAAARRAFDTDAGGWTTDVAFRARCLRQLRDALTTHGDAQAVAVLAQHLLDLGQFLHRRGAHVGALGKAKEHHHHLARHAHAVQLLLPGEDVDLMLELNPCGQTSPSLPW